MSERTLLAAIIKRDFAAFAQRAFGEVEPGNDLSMDPYIYVMAAKLTAIANGDVKRLIVNLPPRHLKSLLISVFFPAWMLGQNPRLKFIIVSHQTDLAEKFSRQIRQIMSTVWYREAFPDSRLSSEHNTASDFQTTSNGNIRATSVRTGVTGFGADIIIVDDPMDASDAASETARTNVKNFYESALSNRLDDMKTGTFIIVAQRLHEDDLPGYLLRTGQWEHLCLPFIASDDSDYVAGGHIWHRKTGEVLSPARFGPDEIRDVRAQNLPHIFETQWQQSPTAAAAGWVKDTDFPRCPDIPAAHRCIMSWDLASKAGPNSDYSACVVLREIGAKLYVVATWRGREEFEPLCKVAARLIEVWKPTDILVEDTALGPALENHLKRNGHRVFGVGCKGRSKEERFQAQLDRFKANDIVLCDGPWVTDLIDEFVRFPYGRFDDQVDALVQALTWLRESPSTIPAIAVGTTRQWNPHPQRDPRNPLGPRGPRFPSDRFFR